MVIAEVDFDRVDDGGGPLDDEALQSILLVQVGVHKLLHSLNRQAALTALLIILDFLRFHIGNDVFELLQWEDLIRSNDRLLQVLLLLHQD